MALWCVACIAAASQQPVAYGIATTTYEDFAVPLTLVGVDPVDAGAVTYAIDQPPRRGFLSGTAPELVYTPFPGFVGEDAFIYSVTNAAGAKGVGMVAVRVRPGAGNPLADQPPWESAYEPACTNSVYYVPAGSPAFHIVPRCTVRADAGYPPGSNVPKYAPWEAPYPIYVTGWNEQILLGQILGVNGRTIAYRPPATPGVDRIVFHGKSEDPFRPNQMLTGDESATITIVAYSSGGFVLERPPLAFDQFVTLIDDGRSIDMTISGLDVEDQTLALVQNGQGGLRKGTLSIPAGSAATDRRVRFTPSASLPFTDGRQSFGYRLTDPNKASGAGVVTLLYQEQTAQQDPPVAYNFEVDVGAGSTQNPIVLAAEDPEGDAVTYERVSSATRGTVTGTGAALQYRPPANFVGTDFIVYSASALGQRSNYAFVTINVKADTPRNDPPIANDRWVKTQANRAVSVQLEGSDPEDAPISVVLVQPPQRGSLVTAPGRFAYTYTPNSGFTSGSDTVLFRFSDGINQSNLATLQITIDEAPVAAGQDLVAPEYQTLNLVLQATDADTPGALIYTHTLPQHGTLGGSAPNLTYTPDFGFTGPDSFTFTASDGSSVSNTGTIRITVTGGCPISDPPLCLDSVVRDQLFHHVLAGRTIRIVPGPLMWQGHPVAYNIEVPPQKGLAMVMGGPTVSYSAPVAGFGTADFAIRAHEPVTNSMGSTLVHIMEVTSCELYLGDADADGHCDDFDPPVANDQGLEAHPGQPLPITLSATDPNGDPLSFSLVEGGLPKYGTLSGNPPNLVYTPNANFVAGMDTFRFFAKDGGKYSNAGHVAIGMSFDFVQDQVYYMALGHQLEVKLGQELWYGQSLRYAAGVEPPPMLGQVSQGTTPFRTYTPASLGEDAFGFSAMLRDPDNRPVVDLATATVHVLADCSSAGGDTDGDGHCDLSDPDDDNDGLDDPDDPCPLDRLNQCVPPPDCSAQGGDTDGDRICNETDPDDDNDGLDDPDDPCPLDPQNQCVPPPDCSTHGGDTDNDRICNDTDPDDDNDGVDDPLDPCPLDPQNQCVPPPDCSAHGGDTDDDRICDDTDPDDDNDGVDDPLDPCPTDPDNLCAPQAQADVFVIVRGREVTLPAPGVLANDSDPEGDALSAVLDHDVSVGVLALASDGGFTYATATGTTASSDAFIYRASDATSSSAPVVVTLMLVAACDANQGDADGDGICDSTDPDPEAPGVDLAISKSNGVSSVRAGAETIYEIVVSNRGTQAVANVAIGDLLPASLQGSEWVCSGSGMSCPQASGSGDLAIEVALFPAGAKLQFELIATVQAAIGTTVSNTASVHIIGAQIDEVAANDSATDSDPVVPDSMFRNGFE